MEVATTEDSTMATCAVPTCHHPRAPGALYCPACAGARIIEEQWASQRQGLPAWVNEARRPTAEEISDAVDTNPRATVRLWALVKDEERRRAAHTARLWRWTVALTLATVAVGVWMVTEAVIGPAILLGAAGLLAGTGRK